MRYIKYILSVGLLALALWFSLQHVFCGFGNAMDPFYWLHKYANLESGWMPIGTILAGGAVVKLFGYHLLPLRIVGWLCVATAVALPYCCLLNKEQRRNNMHWLAITYGLMGYGAFQEFSPGTLTVLLLSAIWVCATKSQITNYKSPILTAVLAGIAVAVRFPNVLVFLILLPLWRKRSLWLVPVAAVSAGLVYLLGYLFVTPAYIDPAMNSHGLSVLIDKMWTEGAKLLGYVLMAIGLLVVGKIDFKNQKSTILQQYGPIALGVLMGAFLIYYVTFVPKVHEWYNISLTYMISAMVIVMAFGKLPIGAIILMIATMGTDVGWLKLFPAVLCLLPVAVVQYDAPMRQYLFPALLAFTVAVMMRFRINSIGDNDLNYCDVVSTTQPFEHIRIRSVDEERIAQYKADKDSLSAVYEQASFLSFGQEVHQIRAVTGCDAARYNEFWSNIFDSVYTAKYQPIIEAEHPIVFCSYSPRFKTKKIYGDRHSRLEEMLRKEGYREIDRSQYKYMIYIPTEY